MFRGVKEITKYGFTIIGLLVLLSVGLAFFQKAVNPFLTGLITMVTWAFLFLAGLEEDWGYTEKELTMYMTLAVGLAIIAFGAFGVTIIPELTKALGELGVVFTAGLGPLAIGLTGGLATNVIIGTLKRLL